MAEYKISDRPAPEVQDQHSLEDDVGEGRPVGADLQQTATATTGPRRRASAWVGNVCGQCHAVTADLFKKSVHAKAFADMGSPGCATCHQNHAIQEPSDAFLGLGDKAVCSTCHSQDDKAGRALSRCAP